MMEYWEIICRRKWVLIIAAMLIPLFTMAILYSCGPIYQSNAKLMVKTSFSHGEFIKGLPSSLGKYFFTDQDKVMGTMEEILVSGPVVNKVIEEMNFRDEKGVLFVPNKFVNPGLPTLLLSYKKGVRVRSIIDTEIIAVSGYSTNPLEAKEIAGKVIKNSFDLFSNLYKEEIGQAIAVLESRMPDIQRRLATAEKELSRYQENSSAYDLTTQSSTLISEISTLEAELLRINRALQANKDALVSTKEALSKQPEFKESETTLESNPIIEGFKTKLYDLEVALAKLLVDTTPDHPDVKTLNRQKDAVKDALAKEIEKTFSSSVVTRNTYYDTLVSNCINVEIDSVKESATKKVLSGQLEAKRMQLNEIPAKEQRVNALTREVNNLKGVYAAYLDNLETARSALQMNLSNILVVQPPALLKEDRDNLLFPPKHKALPLAVAAFMGALGGLFLVFLLHYLDGSLWSVQQVENTLHRTVAGVVPRTPQAYLQADRFQMSPFVDGIHNLLARLRFLKGGDMGKVVSVISFSKGEGKSVLASFIAILLAREGKKTLLVDGNMRSPAIHRMFRLSHPAGLGDFLADVATSQDVVCPTSATRLSAILSGAGSGPDPSLHLTAGKFTAMIRALAPEYDAIIVDTPALEENGDALVITQHADDTIVVLEQGKTSGANAERLARLLAATDRKPFWVALNKAKSV